MVDAIHPQIREDGMVAWYYRQNLVMFASAAALGADPALRQWCRPCPEEGIEWMQVNAVHYHLSDLAALRRAPGGMVRKIVRVTRRVFHRNESV